MLVTSGTWSLQVHGGMIDLQVAAAEGVGTFLGAVGSGLAKRHLTSLVDDGFDMVRSLAVDEGKLIKHGELPRVRAMKVSEAAIEVARGSPGSIGEGMNSPSPSEVDSRRLAGLAPSFPLDPIPS